MLASGCKTDTMTPGVFSREDVRTRWGLARGVGGDRAEVQVPRHSGLGVCWEAQEDTDTPGCQSDPQALRKILGFPEGSRAVTGNQNGAKGMGRA